MADPTRFSLQPVQYTDAHSLALIWIDAFKTDRQTQLKTLAKISYTTVAGSMKNTIATLRRGKNPFVEAVTSDGQIMGTCSLAFVGFDEMDIPYTDPGTFEIDTIATETTEDVEVATDLRDAILRLDEMESADMKHWQSILMPPGSKFIVITGLTVAPEFQGKGVGSALLKWGTDFADRHGVYMWVHSSEGAFRAYSKCGFEVVGTLDVDLDQWAPFPPMDEGENAKWGHYLIRYMKRLPKTDKESADGIQP